MSRVWIDTNLVHRTAQHVAAAQNRFGSTWTTLSGALAPTAGMAGNPGKDQAAAEFIAAYTPAAQAAWQGFAALHRSTGDMSRGLTQTVNNHTRADQHSVIGSGFSMVPRQPSFRDQLLGFVVSGPLNVAAPPTAAGPGKPPPRSLLETLTGISFDPLDIAQHWPTGDSYALATAATAWQAANTSLLDVRGRLATEVTAVTGHSDAPDIDAFDGYWRRLYGNASDTLLNALPQLCAGMASACRQYGAAVLESQIRVNDAAPNPIAAVFELAALRAAIAAAAGKLLQTVGAITVGVLANHLITSVTTGTATATAPNLRILHAETEQEGAPPTYEPGGKHGSNTRQTSRGPNSAEPTDGQEALDNSAPLGENTTRRVGVDKEHGEIVVLDETHPGKSIYHGHVREWDELTDKMKNALKRAGLVDKKGRILK
ncbi:hypothetical protein [Actinomadura rubrisoli]|uniref:Outer membrane channel protein CpnT-like N-terminal domain-containing protein n=1 Tax=Actinomadura rubrisoli TaxID=2530368 RepID=A0A4R4ZRY3_9ACTN|nr:hypothetical protein [Actinomadura rubrisoli]TDD61545.1 hypothetical protein E1298_45325 [Actinomadura rubrisoli]